MRQTFRVLLLMLTLYIIGSWLRLSQRIYIWPLPAYSYLHNSIRMSSQRWKLWAKVLGLSPRPAIRLYTAHIRPTKTWPSKRQEVENNRGPPPLYICTPSAPVFSFIPLLLGFFVCVFLSFFLFAIDKTSTCAIYISRCVCWPTGTQEPAPARPFNMSTRYRRG